MAFFKEQKKIILKYLWKHKRLSNQKFLRKKNRTGAATGMLRDYHTNRNNQIKRHVMWYHLYVESKK